MSCELISFLFESLFAWSGIAWAFRHIDLLHERVHVCTRHICILVGRDGTLPFAHGPNTTYSARNI